MMLLVKKNIFDSTCDAIVNPINVVGVMGGGLALEFKNRYPDMFEKYKELCELELLTVGHPVILSKDENLDRNIILFPTKKHWKNPSKIEYIKDGLDHLAKILQIKIEGTDEIKSIGFPLIGCGLGGLDKKNVIPLIEKFSIDSGIICEIYEL